MQSPDEEKAVASCSKKRIFIWAFIQVQAGRGCLPDAQAAPEGEGEEGEEGDG